MKYDPLTRILHVLLAVGVTAQMLASLVMVYPKPGRLPNAWYELHEVLGVALLALLVAHWLWTLARVIVRGEPMMLFPWLSPVRLRALALDARVTAAALGRGRFPGDDEPRPLAAAVQGLGLLLALFLALTGTIMLLGMAPNGAMSSLVHDVKEAHEAAAPLMWAYLAVHPALGLLHQLAGDRSLTRMFGVRG